MRVPRGRRCRNSVIMQGSRIGARAVIRNAIIDKDRRPSRTGPRSGSTCSTTATAASPSPRPGSWRWARTSRRRRRQRLTASQQPVTHREQAGTSRSSSRTAGRARGWPRSPGRAGPGRRPGRARGRCRRQPHRRPEQSKCVLEVLGVLALVAVGEHEVVVAVLEPGQHVERASGDQPGLVCGMPSSPKASGPVAGAHPRCRSWSAHRRTHAAEHPQARDAGAGADLDHLAGVQRRGDEPQRPSRARTDRDDADLVGATRARVRTSSSRGTPRRRPMWRAWDRAGRWRSSVVPVRSEPDAAA
jgi:hypothetical protein